MNRSLLIITVLGLLAMVCLAGMGSFFIGKVGGLENLSPLRQELRAVFGHQMKNPDDLKIRVARDGDVEGVVVSFVPSATLGKSRERRERQVRRLANHILGQPEWKRLGFVEVHLSLPAGRVLESRFARSVFPSWPE